MDPLNLFTTEHCRVSQARSFDLPGYLIVEMKRPHRSLSAMTSIERADLVGCLSKAEGLVRAHTAAERVYTLRFGEESEQVHFHVVPRTPDVEDVEPSRIDPAAAKIGQSDWKETFGRRR